MASPASHCSRYVGSHCEGTPLGSGCRDFLSRTCCLLGDQSIAPRPVRRKVCRTVQACGARLNTAPIVGLLYCPSAMLAEGSVETAVHHKNSSKTFLTLLPKMSAEIQVARSIITFASNRLTRLSCLGCLLPGHRNANGLFRRHQVIHSLGGLGNRNLHTLDAAGKRVAAWAVVRRDRSPRVFANIAPVVR
jgi:hypothetical protein